MNLTIPSTYTLLYINIVDILWPIVFFIVSIITLFWFYKIMTFEKNKK